MAKGSLLCGLLFVACSALAQPIYKSIDRNGNISYAETPAPNAVTVERIEPLPSPNEKEVRRAEEALAEYQAQTEKERAELLEWEKEHIRLYRAMIEHQALIEASRHPPPLPRQIVYPYGYPAYLLYCPYCAKRHRHHLEHPQHGHKTPHRHQRTLRPDRRRSLLPPHQKAQAAHRGVKQSRNHRNLSPRHQAFSSDSIFLPAKGLAH